MSECMPARMPDIPAEYVPDRMRERSSECMSDKMPDLASTYVFVR